MKKIFISVDLEGITGVTRWDETRYGGKGYEQACCQMSLETAAACRAAQDAGYSVVVKDGHEDAGNIDPGFLPRGVELIRGWTLSPYSMMEGLDREYEGIIYIGYHAGAGSSASPLNHTSEDYLFNWVTINGILASEFSFNSLLADELQVPSLFLSGDKGICEEAQREYPGISVFSTKAGIGDATWNVHPEDAIEEIERGVAAALQKKIPVRPLQDSYTIKMNFKNHQRAKIASWYPGAELTDDYTVVFTADSPLQLAVAKMFMTQSV